MMKSGASNIRGKLNQIKVKKKRKNQEKNPKRGRKSKKKKKQKKGNSKKINQKENPKKKKEKKEFVFGSPGQNVRLLSLPYSCFSAMRKEGQL